MEFLVVFIALSAVDTLIVLAFLVGRGLRYRLVLPLMVFINWVGFVAGFTMLYIIAHEDQYSGLAMLAVWALLSLIEARIFSGIVRSKATKDLQAPAPIGYRRVLVATACGNAAILIVLGSVSL